MAHALALRQIGYTALAISQRLGISIRTLQRHFSATKAKKGALKQAVLESARSELVERISNDQMIKEEAARLLIDDLAHSRHLREVMLSASEQMQATSLKDAVQVMRAAAAYSTALKNTSDVIRHGLRLERLDKDDVTDLPELFITELTAEDVQSLRDAEEPGEEIPDTPEEPDELEITDESDT